MIDRKSNGDSSGLLKKPLFLGIFMVALATVSLELLLPRIWSVTLWYHFAFAAISIAMFGITAGALVVFFLPKLFTQKNLPSTLALLSLLFATSIILSFLTQLCIPYFPDVTIVGLYSLLLLCLVVSIPFVLSGIVTTIALTKFPLWIGQIYAFDLCGAAFGCLFTLFLLGFTDAPTAVICSALFASIGAIFLAIGSASSKLKAVSIILASCIAAFIVTNTVLSIKQCSLLRPIWVKAQYEPRPLYEKWNSFSRVSVNGNPDQPEEPTIWGLSRTYPKQKRARELRIEMDSYLATVIPHFSGDLNEVDYLKYDLTNLAHVLRPNARVLIIGTGGGKDILSALVFNQKSVLGVEINEAVIDTVTKTFGDFSGHLNKDARVKLVNDEARSFIARQPPDFDIMQMSAIDTGMATGAGAYALIENSLYTVEAWKLFLEKLSPHGILSCSRWYNPNLPAEIYRLAALAREALRAVGVTSPRRCVAILAQKQDALVQSVCATALISKEPFSQSDLSAIKSFADRLQFDIVLMPDLKNDAVLEEILSGSNLEALTKQLPARIDATTDDNPYFFYLLKPYQVLLRHTSIGGEVDMHSRAEVILFELAAVAILLSLLSITLPFAFARGKANYQKDLSLLFFFAFIGLGFMFIEVSQLQRLIIFLGHPSYSLSVVLFSLLISSGVGSYLTGFIVRANPEPALVVATGLADPEQSLADKLKQSASLSLTVLIILLVFYGLITPGLIGHFAAAATATRIVIAAAILFPIGILMGTAMPFGLRLASVRNYELMPWFWGVNGACSVCASVATVAIAVMAGISAAFCAGTFCYILALVSLLMTKCDISKTGS